MKKLLFLLFFFAALVSCKKSEEAPPSVPETDYREPYLGTYAVTVINSVIIPWDPASSSADTIVRTATVSKFDGYTNLHGANYVDVISKVWIVYKDSLDINASHGGCDGVPFYTNGQIHPVLLTDGSLLYGSDYCEANYNVTGGFFPGDSIYVQTVYTTVSSHVGYVTVVKGVKL